MSIDFHSRLDEEHLSSFTQRATLWQTWLTWSVWVTDSRMLCFLGPVWCTQSIVLAMKGGSAVNRLYFNVFRVFLIKTCNIKCKDAISGFPVSPGSAEALVRWGGKIKYVFIAYFLGNMCAKNGRNRTMCVKIKLITSQRWDVFKRSVYSCSARLKRFLLRELC